LRSNTASIQLAQCTASSFAASRSGAQPTSWRRDEAQLRPHPAFWCVRYQPIPIQLGYTIFRIEIFPPCKLTNRHTMTADPVAFWCVCYRATPIQLSCTFFFRMEISPVL
jgi:hypothetical protein